MGNGALSVLYIPCKPHKLVQLYVYMCTCSTTVVKCYQLFIKLGHMAAQPKGGESFGRMAQEL